MKKVYVKQGCRIIEEGAAGDCAYIIESGKMEVSKSIIGRGQRTLGILGEKDIFGELSLIDGHPRTATVTALEDCTVTVLTSEAFNSLAKRNPQALMPILKILTRRLRQTLNIAMGETSQDKQELERVANSTYMQSQQIAEK